MTFYEMMMSIIKPNLGYIIGLIVFIVVLRVLGELIPTLISKNKNKSQTSDNETTTSIKSCNKYPYTKKPLLTINELYFYRELQAVADKMNLRVLTKIRIANILEVKKGLNKREWGYYFGMIKAKHIDFLLCNPSDLNIALAIELDDNSHNTNKRETRDDFVNKAFEAAKIPLLRVYGAGELEQKIINSLNPQEQVNLS